MGTIVINSIKTVNNPTISLEHGDRLFWLGRYTERFFSTLKALEKLYDSIIDEKPLGYTEYLDAFGLSDTYGSNSVFFNSFIFDKTNENSAAYSLSRAYDNGIVLREEISTEALSFLQMALDSLEGAKNSNQGLRLALHPLEDIIFGFWGCVDDYVCDNETRYILHCGKIIERLDIYFRLKYPFEMIESEFERLCRCLAGVPKNSPYRYNSRRLSTLVELMGLKEEYTKYTSLAIRSLEALFSDDHTGR